MESYINSLQITQKLSQQQYSPLPKCLQISAWASIICPHLSMHPQPASDEGPVPPGTELLTVSMGSTRSPASERTAVKPLTAVPSIKGTEQAPFSPQRWCHFTACLSNMSPDYIQVPASTDFNSFNLLFASTVKIMLKMF